MAARILDGRELGKAWRAESAAAIARLKELGTAVGVAVVRVGDDEGAASYARQLAKTFAAAGVAMRLEVLPADSDEAAVRGLLHSLSADPTVHGILLQEPVPEPLSADDLALDIDPGKDIDGVHPLNAGKLFQGRDDGFVPATAWGGLELLRRHGVELKGRRVAMVGRSTIVGRPMALLMLHQHATVTICHTRTVDLADRTREADIVVAAVGRPWMITADMVREGAVVVDFGINFVDGELRGDVALEVAEVAGALTPTPGGTGAMTNAALLANLVRAASARG